MNNPYVEQLVQMGYDRTECMYSIVDREGATYPRTIAGVTFQTKEEHDAAVHEFLNGL